MIDKLKAKHPLQMLCNQLNISVSGFLAHQQHPASRRKQMDQGLIAHIRSAHERGRGSYDLSKIQTELAEQSVIHLGITASSACVKSLAFVVNKNVSLGSPRIPNTNCLRRPTC